MPALGPAMSVCDGMDHSREEPGIAITEPGARETPLSCGSVIVDGMGVHNFSTDGRDYIAVKVPTGNTAIFEIEAVYLGSAEVLIYDSDVSELIATLRGKSLPTRTFNTTGNEATIVVTTQDQSEQQPELFQRFHMCCDLAGVGLASITTMYCSLKKLLPKLTKAMRTRNPQRKKMVVGLILFF